MGGRKAKSDETVRIRRMLLAEYPLEGVSDEECSGDTSALIRTQPDYGKGRASVPRGVEGRTAARYKDKRKVKTEDGGTTTVYEYSDRQVQNRHREKAERVEKLHKNISDLRAQVRKDLESKDPDKRLVALAIALMDETYERVGNPESASEGHFGVTGWLVRHIELSRGKATLRYVGKSGVKQEKTVTDAKVLKVLREAVKGKSAEDKILCEGEECSITAKEVNEYLKPYGVTAKDLRGYHANEEMRTHLQALRSKGPKLPEDKKEREALLKDEFDKALEETAEAVGHESSTLRSQYLVPGLEDSYLKDGTVIKSLAGKKALMSGGGRASSFDLEHSWGRLLYSTKTHGEREDEEADKLVRPAPKKKPPRMDLRRHLVDPDKDRDTEDGDAKQDKKDQSQNFKDVGGSLTFNASEGKPSSWTKFLEEVGDEQITNPDTGKQVKLKSLKGEKGQAILRKKYEQWRADSSSTEEAPAQSPGEDQEDIPAREAPATEESGGMSSQEAMGKIKGVLRKSFGGKIPKDMQSALEAQLQSLSAGDIASVAGELEQRAQRLAKNPPQGRTVTTLVNRVSDAKLPKDPAALGKHVAESVWVATAVRDPLNLRGRKVDGSGVSTKGKVDPKKVQERAIEAKRTYMGLDTEVRQEVADKLVAALENADPDSPEHAEVKSILRGVALANIANGEDTKGLPSHPPMMHNLYHALRGTGQEDLLLGPVEDFASPKGQREVRRAIKSMSDIEMAQFAKDDEVYRPFADLLERDDMNEYQKQLARDVIADLATGEMGVLDPMIASALESAGQSNTPEDRKKVREKAVAQLQKEKQHGKSLFSLADDVIEAVKDEGSKEAVRKDIALQYLEGLSTAIQGQVEVDKSKNPAAALVDLAVSRGDPGVLGDAKTEPPLTKPKQAHVLMWEYDLDPWRGVG